MHTKYDIYVTLFTINVHSSSRIVKNSYIRVYEYRQIMITQTLAQEVSQLEADLCFALADPTRILILYALDEQPRNVTEITNELNITQPTGSRH
jgi:hypothetical protein